jgi:hypothetical protein
LVSPRMTCFLANKPCLPALLGATAGAGQRLQPTKTVRFRARDTFLALLQISRARNRQITDIASDYLLQQRQPLPAIKPRNVPAPPLRGHGPGTARIWACSPDGQRH